jgi:hypothetical protein
MKKVAQNVAQTIFVNVKAQLFLCEKVAPKFGLHTTVIFKRLPKANNGSIEKISPIWSP